jgi:hypothetical protein
MTYPKQATEQSLAAAHQRLLIKPKLDEIRRLRTSLDQRFRDFWQVLEPIMKGQSHKRQKAVVDKLLALHQSIVDLLAQEGHYINSLHESLGDDLIAMVREVDEHVRIETTRRNKLM